MISNELERLAELYRDGALTAEEFEAAKRKILSADAPAAANTDQIFGIAPQLWYTIMHLSQVVWWMGGIFVAVVMWWISRDKSAMADRHGRVIINWNLSFLIYQLVSFVLTAVYIGLPMSLILVALSVVFPIIGAVRASEGRLWPYPLSIEFFSTAAEPQAEKI